MGIIDSIKSSLKIDEQRLLHFKKIASSKVEGRLNCRWEKRRSKYCYYFKGPKDKNEKYVCEGSNEKVWKLQQKRFAQSMVRVLNNNIKIKRWFLANIASDLEEDVIEQLPRAYRPNPRFSPALKKKANKEIIQSENPYKRHRLNKKTSFGLFVRSRGEVVIAELLYSLGIVFRYEKALTLRVLREVDTFQNGELVIEKKWVERTVYPDFTIYLPDGRVYYWEHEGLLDDIDYVSKTTQKLMDYNNNGIYQSHNLIVTADGPDNEIDVEGIKKIISGLLLL